MDPGAYRTPYPKHICVCQLPALNQLRPPIEKNRKKEMNDRSKLHKLQMVQHVSENQCAASGDGVARAHQIWGPQEVQ